MPNSYYKSEDLKKFASIADLEPDLANKFFAYYNSVFEKGSLSKKEKSLIALGVALAIQCPYCIDAYTSTALENGSDKKEMMEVAHVSSAIRGGASLVHSVQMMKKANKLSF